MAGREVVRTQPIRAASAHKFGVPVRWLLATGVAPTTPGADTYDVLPRGLIAVLALTTVAGVTGCSGRDAGKSGCTPIPIVSVGTLPDGGRLYTFANGATQSVGPKTFNPLTATDAQLARY